jgi:glucose-6-phosphate dehydrogenase assembly protein OpcA
MALTYKVLGQVAPTDTNLTTLYTVPSATQTVVSTITAANLTSTPTSYRIAIRPAGESISNKHYIAYDVVLDGNDSIALTIGVALQATDVISVKSATSNSIAFQAFGAEES